MVKQPDPEYDEKMAKIAEAKANFCSTECQTPYTVKWLSAISVLWFGGFSGC